MSTRKSIFFSFLDRYASLLITVVSSMVIARLLSPADIGVFSVTMILLMFVNTVRDMGAGQYLVQEKSLTTERIRAVWAVQLGLGLGLASIVLLASHPVAVFYKEPRMRDIMRVVALNYAINPFGSLTYAWLMRQMRFDSVALMRFSGTLTGMLTSIWFAWQGYGPISLAWGALSSTIVGALMAVYFRPKEFPWLPGLSEIRRVLTFGSKLTASSIANVISSGAPELFLGKLKDLSSAGLYSRSNGLVQMFYRLIVDAVGAVCLPWFAKQSREQGNFIDPFLKATAYVTAFGWSFCLAVVCLAHPIVRALYGNQWDASVDLTRLLAAALLFTVPTSLCSTALLSVGAVNVISRVTAISALQIVIFVALGSYNGLLALGTAMIVSAAITSILWLRAISKYMNIPVLHILNKLSSSAAVAAAATIGPASALWIYGAYPPGFVMPLLMGCLGGLVGFTIGIVIFKHPLKSELLSILIWVKRILV